MANGLIVDELYTWIKSRFLKRVKYKGLSFCIESVYVIDFYYYLLIMPAELFVDQKKNSAPIENAIEFLSQASDIITLHRGLYTILGLKWARK